VLDHDLEHPTALGIFEARHFPGHAKRGDAVDARADRQIDDAAEAGFVDVPTRVERRGED
jgi:hypothetical protein